MFKRNNSLEFCYTVIKGARPWIQFYNFWTPDILLKQNFWMILWNVFLTIVISLVFSHTVHAEVMIRDSEIENVIKEAINPIVKAAAVGKVDLALIQNPDINAFTNGGNNIYIYSGLISRFPDIDVFKGVIAHELGHVAGHHVSRQMENMVNQR